MCLKEESGTFFWPCFALMIHEETSHRNEALKDLNDVGLLAAEIVGEPSVDVTPKGACAQELSFAIYANILPQPC